MAAQVARAVDQAERRDHTGIANNVCRLEALTAQQYQRQHQQKNKYHWLWYLNREKAHITADERLSILINLREFCCIKRSTFGLTDYLQLAEICRYLCDWQLLAEAARTGLALQPENVHLKYQLLTACWHMGDYQAAATLATRYVLANPYQSIFYQYYQQIFSGKEFVETHASLSPGSLTAERLYLQPLGHQHVEDFFWQYADARIAELCCLPVFHSAEEWHQWLSIELADKNRTTYAIMHPQWGFIGVVCLIRYQELGFFYYWLGKDFQGYGLGPEAINMLLDHHVNNWQMHGCFAKVYNSNQPSIRAMVKLGFVPLPLYPEAPYTNESFFYQGAERDLGHIKRRLVDLLRFLDSDINFSIKYNFRKSV